MNSSVLIQLQTTPAQHAQLKALQAGFSEVCNALAPIAQKTTCWNRVALHHQAYRPMRLQFPAMGSQMICNAVYSVSRACKLIYQSPQSPFNMQRMAQAGKPLPVLRFAPTAPVYFDRHTLSIRDGRASMYTLDGRMRFNLPLSEDDERRFRTAKLREIVLFEHESAFLLRFQFDETSGQSDQDIPADPAEPSPEPQPLEAYGLPKYLLIMDSALASDSAGALSTAPIPAVEPLGLTTNTQNEKRP